MPIATVDILFINSHNEILLGMRNNKPLQGVYYIPGGRVYKGEHLLKTAKRKAKEEFGIDINVSKLKFLGVFDDILEDSSFPGISTHCIPITYLYHLSLEEEKELKINDAQHSDFRFFSIDDPSLHDMVKIRVREIRKYKK